MIIERGRQDLEGILAELRWRAYARDPLLFFEECVYIPSQRDVRGREQFVPFDYQREMVEELLGSSHSVQVKARQIGASTIVGGLSLWRCLFWPGSVILWVSNNQDNANKAVGMVKLMWHFLPEWVKQRAPRRVGDQAGVQEWEFGDGMKSRIRSLAGTATAGASETASVVVLDEFGLVDPHIQADLLRSTDPTTAAGGRLWMLSTARGAHNMFATTFKRAERGENEFRALFYPWTVSRFMNPLAERMRDCPACDGVGRRKTPKGVVPCAECVDTSKYEVKASNFNDEPWKFRADHPLTSEEAFRESGDPRFGDLPMEEDCFDGWVRGRMRMDRWGEPEFVTDEFGSLRVREDVLLEGPDQWREYVMFVDPSEGAGGDYTAAHVVTWDDDALPDIVAWWHSNVTEPMEAARELSPLGHWLAGRRRAAMIAVETTGGYGQSILTELNAHLDYPNLYVHTPADARRRRHGQKLGFPMSWQKRPWVVDRLADFLREDKMVGHLHPMVRNELATFVRHPDGRVAADAGCHDDLVMSLAGALWVLAEETSATERPKGEKASPAERYAHLPQLQERIESAEREQREQAADMRRRVDRRARMRQRTARRQGRVKIGRS